MKTKIPIHDFVVDDITSIPFTIIPLEIKTEYDTAVPHRHNHYEIFIFSKGGGIHEIDFEEIQVKTGSVHFVSPGQVHILQRAPGSYGYVILFSREFFSLPLHDKDFLFELPFLNNNTIHPFINFEKKDFKAIIDLTEAMLKESKSPGTDSHHILRSYLNILLLKCKLKYKAEDDGEKPENINMQKQMMQKFRVLLEKNFRKYHLVKDYASLLSITPENLNEISKSQSGKTASEIISDRLILEAKRLLLYSELKAKEIAYFLEFQDPSYFNKFFKNNTGYTPTAFRELLVKKYQQD
jgi:AraC family transcriptional regulator, transcriptional activator of pobA